MSRSLLILSVAFLSLSAAAQDGVEDSAAQTFEGSLEVEEEKSLFTNKGPTAMNAAIELSIFSMPAGSGVTVTAHVGGGIQNLCAAHVDDEGHNATNTCLNTPVPAGARISVACNTGDRDQSGGIPGCGYKVTVQ